MRKKAFFGVVLWVSVVLCLSASASVVIDESFDYANNTALNAVWNDSTGVPITYTLDTTFGNGLPSYKMPPEAQGRLANNLGGDYNGTDAQPLEFSIDIYLDSVGTGGADAVSALWSGARQYIELRGYSGDAYGSGSLQNIVALGLNNTTSDFFSNRYFQTRVYAGSSNWYTLDAFLSSTATYRTVGWHTLMAQIKTSTIDFYLDGILAETINRPNAYGFDCLVLGSGITSDKWTFWADNITVEIVPEPATLVMLGIGGLLLRKRS